MTTALASAEELLPGYYVEPGTGAWLSLPWPEDPASVISIAPEIVDWCEGRHPDNPWGLTHHLTGETWRFTRGQVRFLHLWYALDPVSTPERPKWLYRSGVKRGAKGTGKDPLLAAMALAALCGPTRPEWDEEEGRWIGVPHRLALVQIAANSEGQAKDPLRVANAMVGREMAEHFGFDKGIQRTQLDTGSRIEVLTRSEASSEGDPATEIFLNESHHMTESSGGQSLAGVARRNVGKSPGGLARLLEYTNTHMPGENSVAEDSYEAWQAQVSGKTRRQDILYDSREAPPDLSIHDEGDLMRGLEAAYADSPWTDLERIRDEAQDPRISLSESVRFYFSSLPTAEDAWVEPRNVDKLALPNIVVMDREELALFLDCSKSEDATTFSGCRVSDGHVIALGGWQAPKGERGSGWLAPRDEVDVEVAAAFERWDIVWFGVDPSPAKDDETEAAYWGDLVDEWHRRYRREVFLWATPGEKRGSAVSFDMRFSTPGGRERVRQITEEAELTAQAIEEGSGFSWDGDPMLRQHLHNARRRPNQFGISIGKQSRSSTKRVDYAVSSVGARLGRRLVLNSDKRRRKRSGKAVFIP
ncbi:MAG TPA: hypothetical protein VD761_07785 [Solirubrobacterales bacterium]|nr:hypothetical protein [Solirubrobacterales bacterium]